MNSQVQLKISLSPQLNNLLKDRAARLGVPVTQFVKHLIVKEVDEESERLTDEILADKELMKAIRQGEADEKAGRLYDWEDVKKELGLNDYVPHKAHHTSKKRV